MLDKLRDRLAKVDPAVAEVPVRHVAPREGDVRDSLADIGKAVRVLGYQPRYSMDQSLDRAVAWYAEHLR